MEFKDLSEQDKIAATVAKMSLQPLPISHSEFCTKIWEAFEKGKEWEQLERHLRRGRSADE